MSFLKRLGLVEDEESIVPVAVEPAQESVVEVDAEINSSTNVVDEIYAQNDLADKSNSIYTVQALIDTLPDEMTTAKKQSTVSGILMVSGKSVADLLSDAQNRIDILCAARDKIVSDRTDEIAVASADIEELKKAIEIATIKIKEAEEIITATKNSVGDEINVIDNLVKFCEGMNK
jgi:LPS O-antigen subunit length determinant protein (WzzB/FepE family)